MGSGCFGDTTSRNEAGGSQAVAGRTSVTLRFAIGLGLALIAPLAHDVSDLYRAWAEGSGEPLLAAFAILCLLGLAVGVVVAVHWTVSRPLRRITRAMLEVASGDLSVRLPETGPAEIAALARVFNSVTGNLQAVVSQAKAIAEGDYEAEVPLRSDRDELGIALFEMTKSLREVASVCEGVAVGDYSRTVTVKGDRDRLAQATNRMIANLKEITEQIAATGRNIEEASRQQLESARNQAVAVEEMSTTVTELLASAKTVAESAGGVRNQAEQGTQDCETGVENTRDAVRAIDGIRDRVQKLAEHMTGLGTRSQQIGAVLDIIGELSEQTNLLSLNASIEASGAGEAGRRFAVVASEIRKLAERAGDSTEEIRGLIAGIQETVNTAIMATEEGEKAVHDGVRLVGEVDRSFECIAEQAGSTAQAAAAIEMGSRQQATAIEQMSEAVRSIDAGAQQSEAAARQLTAEAERLAEAARRLSGGSPGEGVGPGAQ